MHHRATPRRARKSINYFHSRRQRLVITAMVASAALAALPALPASAQSVTADTVTAGLQVIEVSPAIAAAPVDRDTFGATQYTLVQSPVPIGTAISSGFGYRIPPCAGCSSNHRGIDLLAGDGNPVEVIADGTVVATGNPSGSLGVYVTISHVIDGKRVDTTYGHMAYGSMKLAVGDVVSRGDVVGRVGSTGQSTGPHLYFQVLLDGVTAVDPKAWLAAHVNIAR